jgi:hypothetical protein
MQRLTFMQHLTPMQRFTHILVALLGAQLLLALALSFGGPDHASFQATEPLLTFDASAVDRIDIDEGGANSVSLAKRDGAWVVPSMADFPADGPRVTAFLSKLASLKKGWAAATSAEAAERFKVTDDAHVRRIVLRKGEATVGELWLGTAPSFRQVHARAGGDSNIYNAAFSIYEVGARGEDWMNRNVLSIPDDKIASISIGGLKLDRKDKGFAVAGLAEGETQKDAEVWKLLRAISYPVFEAVQGKGPEALAKVKEPDIEVSIKKTDGTDFTLKYKKEAAGGAYLFTSSASDYLFRVGEPAIQPLAAAKRENLVEAKKPDSSGGQATEKPGASGG